MEADEFNEIITSELNKLEEGLLKIDQKDPAVRTRTLEKYERELRTINLHIDEYDMETYEVPKNEY